MKLQTVTIKNFKRFTSLTVKGIPESARLIMLAGPNGSGKSSFFEALNMWHSTTFTGRWSWQPDYHTKAGGGTTPNSPRQHRNQVQVVCHHSLPEDAQEQKKLIYVRSAYRNDPEYQAKNLGRQSDPLDVSRVQRLIDNDAAIGQNYQRLASQVFDIFHAKPMMTDEFTEAIIKPIREPVKSLFPDLLLNSLADPSRDGTFRFTKGLSEGFHFKNLSGGEKAAFDLILDLVVATRAYNNTLFCIDEPESHMNARLQAELLSVLLGLIPEDCQLMLATHSIGMMRRARDIEAEEPGSVVFLDFDGHDFDKPVEIDPAVPDTAFWNNAYDVALADLASLVAPERVVICEGEPKNRKSGSNYSHDARCYESIFQAEFPESRFIPGGNSAEVADDKRGLAYALGVLTQGTEVIRLIDRDANSVEEVSEFRDRSVRVLTRRNLESYLFDDEVLTALAASVDLNDQADKLLAKKQEILASRPGDPPDNPKPASGEIYVACKTILGLASPGNNAKTFMRDTLAPLVTPDTQVYEEMKRDIFG